MSNANVGDSTPPCQAPVDSLAQFFAGVKGDTGQIVALLRELIDRLTDHSAKPPSSGEQVTETTPATSAPQQEQRPERKPWDVREAEVIQWLVALELQTGKLPTVRSIAQHAKINRGVVYRMDRFLQVYADRKAHYARTKVSKRAKPPIGGVRGFRTAGGGVDAVYPGRGDGE